MTTTNEHHRVSEGDGHPIVQCVECGEAQEACYGNGIGDNMVKRSLCFACLFWIEYIECQHEPDQVIIAGKHYVIGEENQQGNRRWRGYGGSPWMVRFHDGRSIRSTNLWFQGEIPERFRERMPDNAEFWRDRVRYGC